MPRKKKEKEKVMPERVGNDIYGVKSNWKLEEMEQKNTKSDATHSKYYHKYYHGYTEVRTENQQGKVHIDRFYTAPWIIQDVSQTNYIYYRLIYCILSFGSLALFIFLMTHDSFSGTHSVFVAIPTFFSALGELLMFAATLNYIFMHKQMTWYDHHSATDNIQHAALFSSISLGVTALFVVIHMFFGVTSLMDEFLLTGGLLFCGGADLFIWYMEKEMPYKEVQNNTKLPPGEKIQIW